MGKTVLITGTSSGIGRETALYFASKGWNVVATMRNPESRQTDLKGSKPIVVAETIFKAANDESWRLRYTAGSDARLLSLVRKLAPDQLLFSILRGRAF